MSLLPRFAEWRSPLPLIEIFRTAIADSNPLVRHAAVSALSPFPPELRLRIAAGQLVDPVRAVRIATARQLADLSTLRLPQEISGPLDVALDELVAAELASAERPETQTSLGNLEIARRRLDEAEAAFRRALDIDPAWVPAWVNLADLQRGLGREGQAEASLRAALAQVPDAAEAHHALGLSLIRQRRYGEALEALETAWQTDPGSAQFGYVYAVGLHSRADVQGAVQVLEAVLERHPAHLRSLTFLMLLRRDQGQIAEVEAILQRMESYVSNDQEFDALLRRLPGIGPN